MPSNPKSGRNRNLRPDPAVPSHQQPPFGPGQFPPEHAQYPIVQPQNSGWAGPPLAGPIGLGYRPDLQAAFDRLASKKLAKKSVAKLNRSLRPDETVEAIVLANPDSTDLYSAKTWSVGVLALTSARVVFIVESRIRQSQFDAPVSTITNVDWAGGMVSGALTFTALDQTYVFNVEKKDGIAFVERLRALRAALPGRSQDSTLPFTPRRDISAQPGAHGVRPVPTSGDAPRVQESVPLSAQTVTPAQAAAPAQSPAGTGPPPGWYQDRENPAMRRWWDGYRWTEHIQ